MNKQVSQKERSQHEHTCSVCEVTVHVHGEDGCDRIQGGNDDANLTNARCEQKGPGGLPVGFAVPKHLQQHERIELNHILFHLLGHCSNKVWDFNNVIMFYSAV